MNDCVKDANTEPSPVSQEINRIDEAVGGLEREAERLMQKLYPVLVDPSLKEACPSCDTATNCEISTRCRSVSDRLKSVLETITDLSDRCQL